MFRESKPGKKAKFRKTITPQSQPCANLPDAAPGAAAKWSPSHFRPLNQSNPLTFRPKASISWALWILHRNAFGEVSLMFVRRFIRASLLIAGVALATVTACAQDSPSLGDVARQSRQQKQQQDAQAAKTQSSPSDKSTTENNAGQSKDAKSASPAGDKAATGQPVTTTQPSTNSGTPPATLKPAKHVITNDELPQHVGPTSTTMGGATPPANYPQAPRDGQKMPADYWRSQILAAKQNIETTQKSIDDLTASIQYAGANCVSGCVQWNERQKQKQDQVEVMKSQLQQMQQNLENLQEMARQQGYGSSVYDP